MNVSGIKIGICTAIGVIGGTVAQAFGGWDAAMVTLVTLMVIDYVMGILIAALWQWEVADE